MTDDLYILWTSGDIFTAQSMVMMYATNSKIRHWWKEVTVIIWGASAKLITENEGLQEKLKIAVNTGVNVSACIGCAKELGVVDKLEALGIEVKPWGEPLSEIIKAKGNLITV